MKNTLEYKILKYLYENKSNDFIEIIGFKDGYEVLNETIKDLKNRKLLDSKPFSTNPKPNEHNIVFYPYLVDKLDLCRIRFEGIEYLFKFKKPFLTVFEIISIIGFIITFSYGFYQNEKSNSLSNQNESFRIELDSVKNGYQKLKSEYLYLKNEFDLLKHRIELSNVQLNKN